MAMWPKLRTLVLTVAALITIGGCATIMQGTTQAVGVSSQPAGARIRVNGTEFGVTPAVLQLKRKDNHVVVIELDGYQPYTATFTRSLSGWVLGNLVFGGLIGLVVDAASGALYKLSPEQVAATLDRNVVMEQTEDMVYIGVVLQPDPSWTRIGTLAPVTTDR
ncbi:MAG TPA: PEGA domain-containing protein [Longimicrobiales bacterium]|nr:PEGA domain-containing protein [Longimicrobiales bacterium]